MKKIRVHFTTVDFTGGGDGVKALYADENLIFYGDDYHDKIDVKITSFIEGVKWSGGIISEEEIECENEETIDQISNLAMSPNEKLSKLNLKEE